MVDEQEKVDPTETPQKWHQRWMKEIALAKHAQDSWMEESRRIYKIYEGGEPRKDMVESEQSFNILWSNTETLLPAIYNSPPQPDVRRRFRDADPIGKAVSTVLERSLSYEIDTEEFYDQVEDAVLDTLIVGRGGVRVKYEPKFAPMTTPQGQPMMDAEQQPMEEKVAESCPTEHYQWDDFIHGPGKRWKHVPWIGFRHRMKRDELVAKFGEEIAKAVPLNYPDEQMSKSDGTLKFAFGSAEVWEIWDKDTMDVSFISEGYDQGPLLKVPDPLRLDGFWPIPRPIYAIKNSRTLVPKPPYHMYESKARELERISSRINGIVRVCKLRGVYPGTFPELSKLLESGDTDMIAVESADFWMAIAQGNFEKLIFFMPVDKISQVLTVLYAAQNECKQTIYELTGISDVIRGATDPSETATAQRIKSNWGGIRLNALQREVQRFVRDLMRMMADVMCSKYDQQTFAMITGLQFPTAQEKQMAQQQLQQMQSMSAPAVPGMDPLPPPQPDPAIQKAAESPSWEEIMQVMQSDRQRCYKVDIETDSTVSETLDSDMQGLQEVLTGITTFVGSAMPALQSGMISIEMVKSVCLAIVRRARLGSAVEDQIEQMQMPAAPQPDPMQVMDERGKATDTAVAEVKKMLGEIMQGVTSRKRVTGRMNEMGQIEAEVSDAMG